MNSSPTLVINTRNHNKLASHAMPAQLHSFNNSSPIVNDYFINFSASNHCSMFDEQINCINQRKDDQHHQYRRSVVISNTSSNFRSAIFTTNHHHHPMKRYPYRGHISSNLPSSKQRLMIAVDHNQTIGLMQSSEQMSMTSSLVNHLHPPLSHLNESNPCIYHQKKCFSSHPRIRLALRCSCPLDEKQQQQFDEIFSNNDQATDISDRILDECLSRLSKTSSNTLIILSGQYRDAHQIQTTVIASILTRLYNFVNDEHEKDLLLRLNVQEFSPNKTSATCLLSSSDDYFVSSPNETTHYLNNLCSNHHSNPLLITFVLQTRSSNTTYAVLNLLSTNENENETRKERFSDLLMSLALSSTSTRQKQNKCSLSRKRNRTADQSFLFFLNEYLSKHVVYILADIKHEKQVKDWTKFQRLFRMKRNRAKMPKERYDSSSVETIVNRNNTEEIWIDGPLSSPNGKNEIWIDGPSKKSHRQQKLSILSPKHPLLSSTITHQNSSSMNFDTESIVSSHCHLPVLPVFKDHSLLPFRSNQTLPRAKPTVNESTTLDLRSSANKLNDGLELLEKTLENLLVPAPIGTNSNASQSLNRIDQLSSTMTDDEKTKRISRIVSPTRFEKLLTDNQSSNWFRSSSSGPSLPNSPIVKPKAHHHPRTPVVALPTNTNRSSLPSKKPKILSETNRSTPNHRPSLFQRLFGSRPTSTPQQPTAVVVESPALSPLISPLTVTLDSRDDLMPLTTSSTTSSASGRASSSGYESMSNTVLEEMIASIPSMISSENNSIKFRTKSARKDERGSNTNTLWNSPNLRDKSHRQQRLSQLKHRQNELKLELAMTKTFLLMDKNKNFDHYDSIKGHSPMLSNTTEEDELEKEIDHLERRLASAKSQLILITSQKPKQLKT